MAKRCERLAILSSLLIVFLCISCNATSQTNGVEPIANPIDKTHYLDPTQYSFLERTLAGVEVVSLGESIHLTHEFPLVRIGMVRFLNESLGFHLLAFEGSPVDVWSTQDRLLASPRTEGDISQAQQGLFTIWNTPEMRHLFEIEVASWQTTTPLYLTAYDIQPGTGSGTQGIKTFSLLAERLRLYSRPPAGFDENSWLSEMAPLTEACSGYRHESDKAVQNGISVLEEWIKNAAPAVEKKYGGLPHAAILRLIPENLRASLQLCLGVVEHNDWNFSLQSGDAHKYKMIRDTNAAAYVLKLKEVAQDGKLMLWAHALHVFYDSEHQNTSVGELLHGILGPRLYTVVVLAENGGTIVILSDVNNKLSYAPVYGAFGRLRQKINAVCPQDCFLNLRGTQDPLFVTPHAIWIEAFPRPMSLAKNFDGVVWIKHVHAPQMPIGQFLALATTTYRKPPVVYWLAGLFASIVALIVWRTTPKNGKRRPSAST